MNLHTIQQAAEILGLDQHRVRYLLRRWTKIPRHSYIWILTDPDLETLRAADRDHPPVPLRGRRREQE